MIVIAAVALLLIGFSQSAGDARAIEIEIGANDVAYSRSCGTKTACYAPRIPMIKTNLATIVARVHRLAGNRHVLVVLLDYWSVWLGGQYAAAKGDAYVAAAAEMTRHGQHRHQVDGGRQRVRVRRRPRRVQKPSYADDETHYLSNDGDHPNEAGHKRIAAATQAVIEKALHL